MLPLILLTGTLHAAPCAGSVDRVAWQAGAARAETAWVEADLPALQAGIDGVLDTVPCLSEPLARPEVAHLHRLVGLGAFVARDTDAAQQAFAAARAVEPTFVFPVELVPPGNPIQRAYTALPAQGGPRTPIGAPAVGRILIDAEPSDSRPTERPTLVQVVDAAGVVRASAYLRPGDAMPHYEQRALTMVPAKRGARLPLLVGAGVGAAAAAGLYVAAFGAQDAYYSSTDLGEMEGLRDRTQALTWSAAGVGLAATATGAIAVFGATW